MIDQMQPFMLALQERMLKEEVDFRIPHYNAIAKTGHIN